MAFTIHKKNEQRYVHSLVQNLADVPGGVTVHTASLVPGQPLMEGAYIGKKNAAGICSIIKTAQVYEDASSTATAYKVHKGTHFKVGDAVTTAAGKTAAAISAIDRDSSTIYDTITVAATLGAATKGATLVQAKAAGASAAVETPLGRVVDFHDVIANDNLWVPVVVIGTFESTLVPSAADLDKQLPGIVLL